MVAKNNDDMKKIQEDISKLNKRLDNVEKWASKKDQMANDIFYLKNLMSRRFGETDPPSATQSPKN